LANNFLSGFRAFFEEPGSLKGESNELRRDDEGNAKCRLGSYLDLLRLPPFLGQPWPDLCRGDGLLPEAQKYAGRLRYGV
jgi:hypothetical protein